MMMMKKKKKKKTIMISRIWNMVFTVAEAAAAAVAETAITVAIAKIVGLFLELGEQITKLRGGGRTDISSRSTTKGKKAPEK